MTNVIDFPPTGATSVAGMLRDFAAQADAGKFPAAIVITVAEDGPQFRMCVGDASQNALLAALGALDVIRARLVRVIEAEDQARQPE